MFNDIVSALHEFAEGQMSKGGFTRIELLLADIRNDANFNSSDFDELLASLVEKVEAGNEDFAMGISLAAKKADCYGTALREALERRLFDQNDGLSARSQYELASLLIKCGGEFAPLQLKKLDELRAEIPELWLDLALEAYTHDTQGLHDEIVALLLDKASPLKWESLKPRYLKLTEAVPNRRFNAFALKLAEKLSSKDRKRFLDWINERRGTQLSLSKRKKLPRKRHRSILDERAINFVSQNPCLAEAAA